MATSGNTVRHETWMRLNRGSIKSDLFDKRRPVQKIAVRHSDGTFHSATNFRGSESAK